jgi:hypothetical protein
MHNATAATVGPVSLCIMASRVRVVRTNMTSGRPGERKIFRLRFVVDPHRLLTKQLPYRFTESYVRPLLVTKYGHAVWRCPVRQASRPRGGIRRR